MKCFDFIKPVIAVGGNVCMLCVSVYFILCNMPVAS